MCSNQTRASEGGGGSYIYSFLTPGRLLGNIGIPRPYKVADEAIECKGYAVIAVAGRGKADLLCGSGQTEESII